MITAKMNEKGSEALKAFNDFIKNQVLVGIPEDNTSRESDTITNAALLYIHSNGSPLQGIPARPVIEPALAHNKERLSQYMADAYTKALRGDTGGAMQALELTGMAGQTAAQEWFTNPANGWPPLKESTLQSSSKSHKGKRGDRGSPRPLIDSGNLRKAITYVVRREGE